MSRNDVLVVGYPKSGNTWLSRLLGDILNSPVTGFGTAHPICEEGKDRPGKYIVRQLHLKPVVSVLTPNFDAWEYSLPEAQGEKIIFIDRNPLDVMVSVYHYWQMEDMDKAIDAVLYGTHPLLKVGPLAKFNKTWNEVIASKWSMKFEITGVSYEALRAATSGEDGAYYLQSILEAIGLPEAKDTKRINEAIERQSFDNRKKELERNGDQYNYGKDVQLRNLRKGNIGSWSDELTLRQVNRAKHELGKQGLYA